MRKAAAAVLTVAAAFVLFICFFISVRGGKTVMAADGNPFVREAAFYEKKCGGVICRLCPHNCFLPEGARGKCRVRMNSGGKLKTLVYGKPAAVHIDPIEKKPVFHLYPGSLVYSVSTPGCNLSCKWCQNWEISQIYPEEAPEKVSVPVGLEIIKENGQTYARVKTEAVSYLSPEQIVRYALATHSSSVAFTYSEPVVFYEYMYDTARLAKKAGLKTVMVSSGFINREPLERLLPYLDVVKIDLKGFSRAFYRNFAGADLEPVKNTLKLLKEKGVLYEIVNLVVPGLNDSREDIDNLVSWVRNELGENSILFFTRFVPNYQMSDIPPSPVSSITEARALAMKKGLHYVYTGNIPGHEGESTYCPVCGRVLVERRGYSIVKNLLADTGGKCPYDGTSVPGWWGEGKKGNGR